jgi:hypothetical protein
VYLSNNKNKIKNSVALVRKRTIPTERPLVAEGSANFCGQWVSRGQRNGSPRPYSRFCRPEPLLLLPSSSSIVLTRLSGPRSRPLLRRKSGSAGNRTRGLWICSQEYGDKQKLCTFCNFFTKIKENTNKSNRYY